MNMKIYIDYDDNDLSTLSNDLYKLFKNNYDTTILDNNIPINKKIEMINGNNIFTISNKKNNNNKTEIIYSLKDNDTLAKILNDNLSNITNVSKYYQLRSPTNTNLDYYEILRNNKGIVIKYGDLTNNSLANVIYQSINNYLSNNNVYTVKSGDSLYSIANRFNTTIDELKRINNLSSNLLSINQKLIIPNSNNIYIVKSGDSLYSIARKYNTTVDELKKINNLSSNLLAINQKLIIPNNESNIVYIVQKGDSLYSIARKYNTTVDELKRINNLSSNLLSINQKLIIKK